ncbi:MAG: chorismate synthase [bacterium]|nr:chorismate synthase [bacterium]
MASNSFGQVFRVTTWGESHGPRIGCVVDGVPPRIPISEDEIQHWMDRRRPGTSRYTTQRREPDRVSIVSGWFEGMTTGTPLAMTVENVDQRSRDYDDLSSVWRPGHADYTYDVKYGIRDWRGSGRASARETAMRVAAGAVARKVLGETIVIRGAVVQIGPHAIDRSAWDWEETGRNPFWCPDCAMASRWADHLDSVRKEGSSAGAVIEIRASGVPAGLGSPVYGKLDSDLAAAMMSINAVKGVEIGDGFALASAPGTEAADEMRSGGNGPQFLSNRAGGILGGISTGEELIVRFAVKPTSSIFHERRTVTNEGQDTTVRVTGRHDPCVGIRAVPVGEAMMACVLADHLLRHKAQCG